jgi:uncharacterized low-complexity protein
VARAASPGYRREFVSKVHILLQHMGRRGQLDKIGSGKIGSGKIGSGKAGSGKAGSGKIGNGQGPRWKLAPRERDLI